MFSTPLSLERFTFFRNSSIKLVSFVHMGQGCVYHFIKKKTFKNFFPNRKNFRAARINCLHKLLQIVKAKDGMSDDVSGILSYCSN